jgi:hypothetical protein
MKRTTLDIYHIRNAWELESTYNETFVTWLKESIPPHLRGYDDATQRWALYRRADVDRVLAVANRYFDVCTYIDRAEDGALRYRDIRSGRVVEQPGLTF